MKPRAVFVAQNVWIWCYVWRTLALELCSFLQRLVGCGACVQQRNGSALFRGWVLIQHAFTTPHSPLYGGDVSTLLTAL